MKESPDTERSQGVSLRPYVISLIVSLGEFIRSFDISIMAGAILYLREDFKLGPYEEGFAMSSAIIGCVIGALMGGRVCDSIGRKRALFATALLYAISVVGTVTPDRMWEFNLYRIVGGIGVGFASVACPLYIAEISPARIRGRMVMMVQFAMIFGATTAVFCSYILSRYGLGWRWMLASESAPVLLFFVALCFVPESPRWLVGKNRHREGLEILTSLSGSESARRQIEEIAKSLVGETGSYRELFQRGIRKALFIAVALAVLSQMVGMTTLMYYAPTLFQKTGLDPSNAILQLAILNLWNFACTFLAFALVDSLGRRPLLLLGTIGLSASLTLMGMVFHQQMGGVFVLLVFSLCIGFYILSIAPLAWVIMSEVFPLHIRARGIAIATFGLWLTVYLVTQFFPPVVAHMEKAYGTPAGVFWIFAGAALCAFFFTWRFIPETKGRSLEEIAKSWNVRVHESGERGGSSGTAGDCLGVAGREAGFGEPTETFS